MSSTISALRIPILLTIFALAVLAAPGAQSTPAATDADLELRQHLEALDRSHDARLERAERDLARGRLDRAELERDLERARRHLRALERHVRREWQDPAPWLDRLEALGRQLDALESIAELSPEAAAARLEARRARAGAKAEIAPRAGGMSPANDDCAGATAIGLGMVSGNTTDATPDGNASCGYSELSPDVWFRFTPPTSGTYHASTFGSDYDTVLSVHDACPGTLDNEINCSDNGTGLQSVMPFSAGAGQDVWLRVSGFAGAVGELVLEVGTGATISGQVRDAATGEPLPLVEVTASSEDNFSTHYAETSSDGIYRINGLAPGSYRVAVEEADVFLPQVYDGLECREVCGPGTPVVVGASSVVDGVDFELERGATITGQIVDADSGEPLPQAEVVLLNLDGGEEIAFTDDAGTYAFRGLYAGDYVVFASARGHSGRFFGGESCPALFVPSCDASLGAPIRVASREIANDIDVALEPGLTIRGRITDSLSGEPIAFADLEVESVEGDFFAFESADAEGHYEITGLLPGEYIVSASTFRTHHTVAYDGVLCTAEVNCVTEGTPVPVEIGSVTEGIDIALAPRGSISGRVVSAATGEPLEDVELFARSSRGFFIQSTFTGSDGGYLLTELEIGEYEIVAQPGIEFLPEVFDDIPCTPDGGPPECDFEAATAATVGIGSVTPAIDFALESSGEQPPENPEPGRLSGRVRAAGTGAGLAGVEIDALSESGRFYSTSTDASGAYRFEDLPPGRYYVAATEARPYVGEVFGGPLCPFAPFDGCDLSQGQLLTVEEDQTLGGIDFELPLGAEIAGRVVAAQNNQPLPFMQVEIWDLEGELLAGVSTDLDGFFQITGLGDGVYFASVRAGNGYSGQIYGGDLCPDRFSCDPTLGTPIELSLGEIADEIDFELPALASISGRVIDAESGEDIEDGSVVLWEEDGTLYDTSSLFFEDGQFNFEELTPGTYFLGTRTFSTYVDELFGDIDCPFGSCDPTRGVPVVVGFDTELEGLELSLERGAILSGTVSDAFRGQVLENVDLELWSETGELLASRVSDFFGRYAFEGLAPGRYYLQASRFSYEGQLYSGVLCDGNPFEDCDLPAATAIDVTASRTIYNGFDFRLLPRSDSFCSDFSGNLCLGEGRFKVEVEWEDLDGVRDGAEGEYLTGDAGYFTFVDPDNIEILVKVVNACTAPYDRFWIFAAGLTNLEVEITVTDTLTDQSKTYGNDRGGPFEPVIDTQGFATCTPPDARRAKTKTNPVDAIARAWERYRELHGFEKTEGDCVPGSGQLCLENERFEVSAVYETFDGATGSGRAMPLTPNAGYFWFFDPENVEVVVKVLDACVEPYDRYWVFAAGLTNLGVDLRVVDTVTGEEHLYPNPVGRPFAPVVDTTSFDVCP